jgi:hypothetical protein
VAPSLFRKPSGTASVRPDRRVLLGIVIDPQLRTLSFYDRVDPIHGLTGLVGVEIEARYAAVDEVVPEVSCIAGQHYNARLWEVNQQNWRPGV